MEKESPIDPVELVVRFKDSYVNFYRLWRGGKQAPEGVNLRTPGQSPIRKEQLSEQLRTLLSEFKEAHPESDHTFIKYVRMINGKPATVVEDDSGLPPPEQLLVLSQTTTVYASDFARIVTEIFVARRR